MAGGIEPKNKIITRSTHCSYLTCAEVQLEIYKLLNLGLLF